MSASAYNAPTQVALTVVAFLLAAGAVSASVLDAHAMAFDIPVKELASALLCGAALHLAAAYILDLR